MISIDMELCHHSYMYNTTYTTSKYTWIYYYFVGGHFERHSMCICVLLLLLRSMSTASGPRPLLHLASKQCIYASMNINFLNNNKIVLFDQRQTVVFAKLAFHFLKMFQFRCHLFLILSFFFALELYYSCARQTHTHTHAYMHTQYTAK